MRLGLSMMPWGLSALAVVAVGCSNGASVELDPTTVPRSTTAVTTVPTLPAPSTTTSDPLATSTSTVATTSPLPVVPRSPECAGSGKGVAWQDLGSVNLQRISHGDDVEIYAAEYPLPGPTEGLWSQWGQGAVSADGRFLSAVGDHVGPDGNSHFFVYEPVSRELTRFMDVLSVVDRPPGSWGFGKIHAQMVSDSCQRVWAATYWGTSSGIRDYGGDHLILIDPIAESIADQGILAEGRGIPSLAVGGDGALLIGEAVDPLTDGGLLSAWDGSPDRLPATLEDSDHTGFRALGHTADGRVLFSVGDGGLMAWDPGTGESSMYTDDLPGQWMRAATDLRSDGSFVGVTQDPPWLFSVTAEGEVDPLGDPGGYTTSLALDDEGGRVFWMAGAHGDAWRDGATVMSLDLDTGERRVVVGLKGAFESELGLLPGGTYSMVYDQGRLFVGVNSSVVGDDTGFGTVVLVVIEGL